VVALAATVACSSVRLLRTTENFEDAQEARYVELCVQAPTSGPETKLSAVSLVAFARVADVSRDWCTKYKQDLLKLREERRALEEAIDIGGSYGPQKNAVKDRIKKIEHDYR
jgi:hypothetical protein